MDSRLATAALVALLVVATAVLGLTFGGGSTFQNPAGGGSGQASQSKTVTGTFPRIVVRAEAYGFTTSLELVNPEGPNTTSVTGIAVLPTPFPMAGVRFVLTELTGPGVPPSDSGALHSYSLTTNSSGVGVTYVLPGNYTVTASGSSFNFTTTVGMLVSTTTHLNVSVSPALEAVGSVVVANQDRVLGVEPTAAIYANVVGRLNYTLGTPYYLVGTLPGSLGLLELAVGIVGSYPSPIGSWAVLNPTAPHGAVPSQGVYLLHFTTNSTVRYSPD